mmetsp:Transcript_16811/g.14744  ORF Transcript_16811/g.14744 Transcript_16811/m.14744 type:complete len:141 (-) Transcript_16811:53-475(-)
MDFRNSVLNKPNLTLQFNNTIMNNPVTYKIDSLINSRKANYKDSNFIDSSTLGPSKTLRREFDFYEGCKTSRNYGTKSKSLLKNQGYAISAIGPNKSRSKKRRKGTKNKQKASVLLKTPLKVLSTQDLTGSILARHHRRK